MPGPSRKAAAWLPILVILVAMTSIQSGASLANSLFPVVGAPGVTALRLALGNADSGGGVQAMAATFLPGAARAAATVRPGARGDELSLLFIPAAHSARRGGGPGVYRPAGGGAVWFCAARWILSG